MPTGMRIREHGNGKALRVISILLSGLVFFAAFVFAQEKESQFLTSPVSSKTDSISEEPISLEQAIQIALEKNPLRKAALADQKAAAAGVQQARSLLLPHIGFSETATRGNDPVYVFGTKLRQQRFTTADFALNALNRPTPISNFSSTVRGRMESLRLLCKLAQPVAHSIHAAGLCAAT